MQITNKERTRKLHEGVFFHTGLQYENKDKSFIFTSASKSTFIVLYLQNGISMFSYLISAQYRLVTFTY